MFDGLGDEWSSVAAELMICVVSCGEDLCAGSIDSCGSELAREDYHLAARDTLDVPASSRASSLPHNIVPLSLSRLWRRDFIAQVNRLGVVSDDGFATMPGKSGQGQQVLRMGKHAGVPTAQRHGDAIGITPASA